MGETSRAGRLGAGRAALLCVVMLGAAGAGFAVQYALLPEAGGESPVAFSAFNALHFQINYLDHGFVKRGLVGTVVQVLPWSSAQAVVIGLAAGTVVALAALVTGLLLRLRGLLAPHQHRLLVAVWIALPAGFLNLGYDFARLDHLNFLLLALSLWLARRRRTVALAGVSVAALLIHEAYLFYGVLPAMAYLWSREMQTPVAARVARLAVPAIATVATLAVIARYGAYEPGREALVADLGGGLVGRSHNALNVWLRSGAENPYYVAQRWSQGLFGAGELLLMLAIVALVLAALVIVHRRNGHPIDAFALSPLAVLPLFVFGIDYARWLSLIVVLALVVITTRLLEGRFTQLVESRHVRGLTVAACLSAILGPLGSVHLFPLVRALG